MKSKIFVSGCLGGAEIRYNGTGVAMDEAIWKSWEKEDRLFYYCPELAVGFPVPRPSAEIVGGTANEVIIGKAKIFENTDNDVTGLFLRGAKLAVEAALEKGVVIAVMTDGSPSCGSTYIGSGNFDGKTVKGRGVVAQMLNDAGIKVFPHTALDQADQYLRSLKNRDSKDVN